MVDLKSMGGCADLAGEGEGAQTSPMASGGRGRVNRERERVREREGGSGRGVGGGLCATSMRHTGMGRDELVGRHVAATDEPRSWSD